MQPIGLRERKKVATKDALSQAALELALERGLHAVTADAIAEAADVSPRTFHNYFSSKEDAVLSTLDKMVHGVVESFIARDRAEPVLDSLEAVLIELVESSGLDRIVAVTRLMAQHPTLIARQVATFDRTSDALLAEIGRRTGTDPAVDLYPRLVYHASTSVARAVVELHMTNNESDTAPTRRSLAAAIHDGFTQLRRGLPQPAVTN
jgi:AcrR family transcriptional regulator